MILQPGSWSQQGYVWFRWFCRNMCNKCICVYIFMGVQLMQHVPDREIAEKIGASPPAVCVGCPWVEWHFKRTISEGEGERKDFKEMRSHWWASWAWTQERREMRRRERVWEGQRRGWDRDEGGREREGGGWIYTSSYITLKSLNGRRGRRVCFIQQACFRIKCMYVLGYV